MMVRSAVNEVSNTRSVTDHSKGNKKVAGLVMSAASGPGQVEAALLFNDASRFGKTVNPMLQQLLSVWQPGGQSAASGSPAGGQSTSSGKRHSASSARLHTATASDNSASIGIADGWHLDPSSASSTMTLQYGFAIFAAQMRWCESALHRLRRVEA
ncbi:MAG: hypothetical protein WCG85_13600 [Polyangia bacterium]